jgi:hypothetical protein
MTGERKDLPLIKQADAEDQDPLDAFMNGIKTEAVVQESFRAIT